MKRPSGRPFKHIVGGTAAGKELAMTRQIPATIKWLIIGLVVTASLVVALLIGSDPTASAATPANGSSCAHPWKETYDPFRPDMPVYNKGAQKVIRFRLTGDLQQFGDLPIKVNSEHATASVKKPGMRICSFKARLHATAHAVKCTHSSFSSNGWSITNPTGATCNTWEREHGYVETITITAAHKR